MKLKIRGGMPLKGAIDIPADKSLTHRGLMFGALGDRSLTVKALGAGEDNHSTAEVLRDWVCKSKQSKVAISSMVWVLAGSRMQRAPRLWQ